MAHQETRTIATYLRNGTLWVGQFVVERIELDFGDERRNALHGLARYARATPARAADWIRARVGADHRAAADKHAALREMRAALQRLRQAA